MQINLYVKYPYPYFNQEKVQSFLSVIGYSVVDGYTLNDRGEIVEVKCRIANNESYNYHNNYDDSEDEMQVKIGQNDWVAQWFTLKKDEVEKAFEENLKYMQEQLQDKLPNHLTKNLSDIGLKNKL